jgi:hypothetical protein
MIGLLIAEIESAFLYALKIRDLSLAMALICATSDLEGDDLTEALATLESWDA